MNKHKDAQEETTDPVHGLVHELVRATVRELIRQRLLSISCDEVLVGRLTDDLYNRITPYKRVLVA